MDSSESGNDMWRRDNQYVKSWTAFIGPVIMLFLGVVIAWFASALSWKIGAVIMLFTLISFAYKAFMIRSVVLFTNDAGVWMFSGIFPWSRGYQGVKWRDLDEASMYMGFFSWAFKSYDVRIGHRFTRTSELRVGHIKNGDEAVSLINRQSASDAISRAE